jgi:DNA-binding GntR family transcriptional regulator
VSVQGFEYQPPRRVASPPRRPRHLHSANAYRELKRRIVTGQYPGGAQFLEEQLARELGISRTPLKEALLNL